MPKPRPPGKPIKVTFRSPQGRAGWRVKYDDPDTGKIRSPTIPKDHARTKSTRERYRAHIEREINERRIDLERGATRKSGTSLREAADRYFDETGQGDEASYRLPIDDLVNWHAQQGVHTGDDLTKETLGRWRARQLKGKKKNGEPWSKDYVDSRLRKAKTAVFYMHENGWLPSVTEREIRKGLQATQAKGAGRRKKGSKKGAANLARRKPKPILMPDELRDLFAAADRHDADTFGESDRTGIPGRKRLQEPLAPFYAFMLLTGIRREEVLALTWAEVDLTGDGMLDLHEDIAKHGHPRQTWLDVCPTAKKLLAVRKQQTGGKGYVWHLTDNQVNTSLKALRRYGAPQKFDNKALRRTCASYLHCAPGIYGGGHVSMTPALDQLGHSYDTARRHYVNSVRNIDPDAKTLEAALEIEPELAHVVEMMQRRRPKKKRTA